MNPASPGGGLGLQGPPSSFILPPSAFILPEVSVDARILELTREPPHFAYEAYEFVCDAVTYTMQRLGRDGVGEDDPEADPHVSGAELLRGVCDLAVTQFGLMAPVVFKMWNVRTTDDVGRIVFDLIKVGRLSKSDRDSPADFRDLFDLPRALADGFEQSEQSRGSGSGTKRGDR
jgi:uncharacterized repeat protein (TIGR04138 family)